jgi:NAD(P)-dependent dehydrogenase (short-subunit alcohol dehydrogenase family)
MPSLKGKTVLIIGRAAASNTSYARLLPGPEAVTGIPARCIGTAEDIAAVALMALTNGSLTGASIPVDGGEHLV